MTNDKAIDCNLSLLEFMKIENMLHPNCVFADDNFEALEMANSALKAQSADSDCITDEQAIEHLQSTGWMLNHDREMYESGLRKQLADDSRSYDALIPSEDTISRKAAIDAIVNTVSEIGLHDNSEVARYGATFRQHEIIDIIEGMPSAQPEIVRCKDCKWKQGAECVRFAEVRPFPDDFCSRAERRTDSNGRD